MREPVSAEVRSDAGTISDGSGADQHCRSVRGQRYHCTLLDLADLAGGSVVKGSSADLVWTGEMGHHEILAFTAAGQHVILCALRAGCPS